MTITKVRKGKQAQQVLCTADWDRRRPCDLQAGTDKGRPCEHRLGTGEDQILLKKGCSGALHSAFCFAENLPSVKFS